MKALILIYGLQLAQCSEKISFNRKIVDECSSQQGREASFSFAENGISKISIDFDEKTKNDYNGLEILMHHSSYKRPIRCDKKVTKKTLRAVKNNLSFVCKGKGKNAVQFITASKVQIYIKKKPKKNTKRCLDFGNVNIYGNINKETNNNKEESRFEPNFGDKIVPTTESLKSGGHEICSNLKNVDKISGLFKNGEWNFKEGGYQFNSFLYLPFKGNAITNWQVKVKFSNEVTHVTVWNALANKIGSGHIWNFVANENTPIMWGGKFQFNFLGRSEGKDTKANVELCYDTYDPNRPSEEARNEPEPEIQKTTAAPPSRPTAKPTTRATTKATSKPTWKPIKKPTARPVPPTRTTPLRPTPTIKPVTKPMTTSANAPKPVGDSNIQLPPQSTSSQKCSGPSGHVPKTQGQSKVWFHKSSSEQLKLTKYDLNEVLTKSILFYEAQRSGDLPDNNRILWRGDSGLKDGCDNKVDLTGGWYDAGDYVKFGFPMAFSTTLLSWGTINYQTAYSDAKQLKNAYTQITWTLDYFVKCHTKKEEFYFQVGDGESDHSYWGRAEEMNMHRPSYKITPNKPGSDVVAETAAALAAGSIAIKHVDPTRSKLYLKHAIELFHFANKHRGKYSDSFKAQVADFYKSWDYKDEIAWAAAWIFRATRSEAWKSTAEKLYGEFGIQWTGNGFNWDDKKAGTIAVMAETTKNTKYYSALATYVDKVMRVKTTPKGLVYIQKWAPNRHAANVAFIAAQAAALKPALPKAGAYFQFAQKQMNYFLGSTGRSFVVGFGKNPPKEPHHRGSSCPKYPARCDWAQSGRGAAPFTLFGALVGGPNEKDKYTDDRGDYIANEVATDYNAGFQSLVAAVKCKFMPSCSPNLDGDAPVITNTPTLTNKPVVTDQIKTTPKPVTTPKTQSNLPSTKPVTTSTGNYQLSGDITVYAPKPDGGNCGYPKFSEGAKKYFVALPKADYDNSMNCGRCIEAKCIAGNVGTNCDNGKPTIMMVTDSCPECHSGDLDLSYAAWDKITGGAGHSRFKADWKYVPCPDSFLVTKTISFYIKPGSSRWWFAVMPLGGGSIKDVKVSKNGRWESMKTGEIDSYYYLAKGLSESFDIKFINWNGKEITHRITNPKGGQHIDTNKQF